ATSREGKAQVSLAQMEYMLPRLRGWGESLSRQAGGRAGSNGGVGLRGPGETKIETDRRRIRERMARLRREIKGMKQARDTKRHRRRATPVPSIAIAGYTNAGKSSLLNRITGAGVLVQNALFATLDPTTRRAELPDGRQVVFTDTVGFVRHLPTQLVEAFRSTLEEVVDSELLVHVVDGSDAFPLRQIEAVRTVVNDVVVEQKAEHPRELLDINKIDAADPVVLTELHHALPDAAFVSAATGEGIDALLDRITVARAEGDTELALDIPYARGDLAARVPGGGRGRPAGRGRAWSGSELPEDRDHSAQDGGVLSGDGAECRVVWEEPDARGILAERLDGGFAVDHRGDDLAVVRDVLPTHHDVVAVADRG